MEFSVQPEDLVPGNYVRVNGDVGRIMVDLDCLSPVPEVDRPEEWIAVDWMDGSATAVHLSDVDYAGRRNPEASS